MEKYGDINQEYTPSLKEANEQIDREYMKQLKEDLEQVLDSDLKKQAAEKVCNKLKCGCKTNEQKDI